MRKLFVWGKVATQCAVSINIADRYRSCQTPAEYSLTCQYKISCHCHWKLCQPSTFWGFSSPIRSMQACSSQIEFCSWREGIPVLCISYEASCIVWTKRQFRIFIYVSPIAQGFSHWVFSAEPKNNHNKLGCIFSRNHSKRKLHCFLQAKSYV